MFNAALLPYRQRALLRVLAQRELQGRYRGHWLGALWPWLSPLLMLAVFTLVFAGVLGTRLPGQASGGWAGFAIVLFAGLLLSGFFNELVGRAPQAVLSQPNYVKKVVFPLHVLVLVDARVAATHLLAALAVLLVAAFFTSGPAWSWLALPLVVAPLLLLGTGLAWCLAALGVYFRDLAQLLPPLLTAALFLSPAMYSRASAPEGMREWMVLNPLTVPIEQMRRVVFEHQWPEWTMLGGYAAIALFVYWAGFSVFRRLMKGFADVL